MPTPRTHARSVISTCDILSLTLIIHDDEYRQTDRQTDRQTNKQIKRVVSYYRTTYRRGDKAVKSHTYNQA